MSAKELGKLFDKECPGWETATVLLKDARGTISGWGFVRRMGEGAVEVSATSDPSGGSLLSASLPEAGA